METIYSQVIDVPLEYIFNGLITLVGGGIIFQFKAVMKQLHDLTVKTNAMQIDITEIKVWMKFKDKQDDKDE